MFAILGVIKSGLLKSHTHLSPTLFIVSQFEVGYIKKMITCFVQNL